ncbi:MAG: hypothetical protein KDK70_42435 [Myxococcales bacterium]|nr:hypothetical protein [Myxococcales bacterium]
MARSLVPLLLLVVPGLAGCPEGPPVRSALELHGPEAGAAPPAATDDDAPAVPSALVEQMHQRLALVSRIQQATIRGDMARAKAAATELAAVLHTDAPESFRPFLRAIDGELEVLAQADDLRTVGGAVARVGLGCGRCHEAGAVAIPLPEPPTPQPSADLPASMQVHRWAADRMWEGLVVPSDDRWIRGSTMFIAIPGCPEATPAEPDAKADPSPCTHAQSLARRGHVTRSLEGRAAIYGRLLSTCAECHTGTSGSR